MNSTTSSTATDSSVVLEPLGLERASILNNLFELYVYDFSEHMPLQLQDSGRFEITPGQEWWSRDDHFAFLIRWRDKLAGFALARTGSRVTSAPDVMDVAEFFVLRGLRGRGIGRSAAHALFRAFPGSWEVRVRRTNVAALGFWSRAAETCMDQPVAISPFSSDGVEWDVLRLETSRA